MSNWCCILNIYFFYMCIINFFHCLFSTRVWNFFCFYDVYSVCYEIRWYKSLILTTVRFSFLLMHSQYLMKNSLTVLNIVLRMSLFSIFAWNIYYLVVLNILFEMNSLINPRNFLSECFEWNTLSCFISMFWSMFFPSGSYVSKW